MGPSNLLTWKDTHINDIQTHIHHMFWSGTVISGTSIAIVSICEVSSATEVISKITIGHLEERV